MDTPNRIQYLNADGKLVSERVRRMDGRDYITASGKIVSPTRVMGVDDSEPRRVLFLFTKKELKRVLASSVRHVRQIGRHYLRHRNEQPYGK